VCVILNEVKDLVFDARSFAALRMTALGSSRPTIPVAIAFPIALHSPDVGGFSGHSVASRSRSISSRVNDRPWFMP
jgi:hypothetical protein